MGDLNKTRIQTKLRTRLMADQDWLARRAAKRVSLLQEPMANSKWASWTDEARKIEESPWIRLSAFVGVFITIFAFWFEVHERQFERNVRVEERTARAWQILTTKSPGNSGKKEALEILFRNHVPIVGLDLSCEAMGGKWVLDEVTSKTGCAGGTYLVGLNFTKMDQNRILPAIRNMTHGDGVTGRIRENRIGIQQSLFSGSNLTFADIQYLKIANTNFDRAQIGFANFTGSEIRDVEMKYAELGEADFSKAQIKFSDFNSSNLTRTHLIEATIIDSNFPMTNLTGANFTQAIFINSVEFQGANLEGAIFTDAEFGEIKPGGFIHYDAFFRNANITAVNFKGAVGLTPQVFQGAYADRNAPPKGLSVAIMQTIKLCDPHKLSLLKYKLELNRNLNAHLYLEHDEDCNVIPRDLKTTERPWKSVVDEF